MKSKNELIRLLDIKLKSNLTNALLSKELNQELLKKNLNVNLTGALFNGLKEVVDLTNPKTSKTNRTKLRSILQDIKAKCDPKSVDKLRAQDY